MKKIIQTAVVEVCSYDELSSEDRSLVDIAREAVKCSYAPYSCFNVGAAVRLVDGMIVIGSNQENAAYPSGMCAERVALFGAGTQCPDKAVEAIAIAARTSSGELLTPISPCGACRQVMLETEMRFSLPMRIILFGVDCCYVIAGGAKELLPISFNVNSLEKL